MQVGLECTIGRGRVVVPASTVERLDNLAIAPRLASWPRRVSGMGVCGDQIVVAVSLSPVERTPARTSVGLLLQPRSGGVRWALEITSPLGLVTVNSLTPNPGDTDARPRWMWTAATSDREGLLWLDVDGMIAALGGQTGSAGARKPA